jgi:hypothetical protein
MTHLKLHVVDNTFDFHASHANISPRTWCQKSSPLFVAFVSETLNLDHKTYLYTQRRIRHQLADGIFKICIEGRLKRSTVDLDLGPRNINFSTLEYSETQFSIQAAYRLPTV